MMNPGCLAEFPDAPSLLQAARALRDRHYRRLDAFTPYEVEGLDQALGLERSWLTWILFPLALSGAGIGYLIQWYVNAVDYPLNVGGRPPHSWPMFIPITFETGILFTGVLGFLLFFLLSRLPKLWHPLFQVPEFASASVDGFWLGIDRRDPALTQDLTRALLVSMGASHVVFLEDGPSP
jgi:hypothetical protein